MKPITLRPRIMLFLVSALVCGTIAGCGEVSVFGRTLGEKQPASETKADATVTPVAASRSTQAPSVKNPSFQVVKSVTLVLTPQATAKVADDARFNKDALLAAIKSELKSRKLLDDTDSHAGSVEISLEDYAMRPTSNAIVFGNVINSGALVGTIRLRDGQGDLQSHRINVEERVSIPAQGESANPLAPLYRQFAVTIAHRLAGTKAKPIIGADQHPRLEEPAEQIK